MNSGGDAKRRAGSQAKAVASQIQRRPKFAPKLSERNGTGHEEGALEL